MLTVINIILLVLLCLTVTNVIRRQIRIQTILRRLTDRIGPIFIELPSVTPPDPE